MEVPWPGIQFELQLRQPWQFGIFNPLLRGRGWGSNTCCSRNEGSLPPFATGELLNIFILEVKALWSVTCLLPSLLQHCSSKNKWWIYILCQASGREGPSPRGMGDIFEETIATLTQGQTINSEGTNLVPCQGKQYFFTFSLPFPTTVLKIDRRRSALVQWLQRPRKPNFCSTALAPCPCTSPLALSLTCFSLRSRPCRKIHIWFSFSFYSSTIWIRSLYGDLDGHLGGGRGGGEKPSSLREKPSDGYGVVSRGGGNHRAPFSLEFCIRLTKNAPTAFAFSDSRRLARWGRLSGGGSQKRLPGWGMGISVAQSLREIGLWSLGPHAYSRDVLAFLA